MVRPASPEVDEVFEAFVCVRVVKMQGAALSLFQFDFDQTWAVFFVAPDKTIYGRYGSRSAVGAGSEEHVSVAGLVAAAKGALALHRDAEARRAGLAPKTGPKPPAPVPEELPGLDKGRFTQPLPRGCMHCHNAWEGWRRATRPKGKAVPDEWLWVYPMPEVLGFALDRDEPTKVTRVEPGSAAAQAGLEVGDLVRSLNGQPILSCADVQWVLNGAPAKGSLELKVARGDASPTLAVKLAEGWRRKGDLDWRPSSFALRPGARFASVSDADRTALGKGKPVVGLRLTQLGAATREAAKAGLQVGDVLLALDGDTTPRTVSEFMAFLFQEKRPGQKVDLLIDRAGTRQHVAMDVPP